MRIRDYQIGSDGSPHSDPSIATVIAVDGDLDIGSIADFRRGARETIATHNNHVIVDLTDCDFIDSAGLGALVGVARRAKGKNVRCVLVAPDFIEKTLVSVDFDRIFSISKSVRSSLTEFDGTDGAHQR